VPFTIEVTFNLERKASFLALILPILGPTALQIQITEDWQNLEWGIGNWGSPSSVVLVE